jgi:hypothetical protein
VPADALKRLLGAILLASSATLWRKGRAARPLVGAPDGR